MSLLRSLAWLTTSLAILAAALAASTYRNTPAEAAPVAPSPHPVATAAEENPRVKPGLVNWHASFADAQTASQKSGKPVLLIHMMGQLDRQFC